MPADPSMSSSDKALRVLQVALDTPRFTGIVEETGLARTTVHRLLRSLVGSGHLVTDSSGGYHPGPAALRLATTALANTDVVAIARPTVEALGQRLSGTIHLGLLSGDEVIYLLRVDAPDKPYHLSSAVGVRRDLYCTAVGKCLLASMGDDALRGYLTRVRLRRYTPNTIGSIEKLRQEVSLTRRRGWGFDNEETEAGVACVAAPITDQAGVTRHALSVSVLTYDISTADLVKRAGEIVGAAAEISANLGHNA